jgi:hypothetical protein
MPENLPNSNEQNAATKLEQDIRSGERWLIGINSALLVVTVIIACIYYGQLCQMKRAVNQAEKANNITRDSLLYIQRAFVFVTKFDVTRLPAPPGSNQLDGSMRFAFQWENGGNTPTKDMSTHISERWFPQSLPADFAFPDYPEGGGPFRMLVGPKADARSAPIFVSAHDILAIHAHKGHLYFWGWARYHDVFPGTEEHITRFCTEITDVIGDLPKGNVNLQTANCPRGNCYDGECKNQ